MEAEKIIYVVSLHQFHRETLKKWQNLHRVLSQTTTNWAWILYFKDKLVQR